MRDFHAAVHIVYKYSIRKQACDVWCERFEVINDVWNWMIQITMRSLWSGWVTRVKERELRVWWTVHTRRRKSLVRVMHWISRKNSKQTRIAQHLYAHSGAICWSCLSGYGRRRKTTHSEPAHSTRPYGQSKRQRLLHRLRDIHTIHS